MKSKAILRNTNEPLDKYVCEAFPINSRENLNAGGAENAAASFRA